MIVVDPGRTPLAGALVRGSAENGWAAERETDESGRAELGVPAAIDEVVLLVELDGFAHQRVKQQVSEEIELVLFPATILQGRVLERGTGRAIPGAAVERKHVTCTACPSDRTSTDDTGHFELSGVPSGSADQLLRFLVRAAGYVGVTHEFVAREPGVALVRDFELEPRTELSGQVVDLSTGEPIAGACLATGDDAFLTDESGSFSTAGPLQDLRIYGASSDELYVFASGYCQAWLPLAQLETPLLIRLPRGAILVGSVLDPEGRPVSGASLHLSNQRGLDGPPGAGTPLALLPGRIGDGQVLSSTGVDGRYRFEEVLPWCDTHRLYVQVEGYPPVDLAVPIGLPGKELELDVVLQRAATGTIHGQLTLNGSPVSGTILWQQDDVRSGETKAEGGRYRLEHLPVGPIELMAMPIGKEIDHLIPEARAGLVLASDQELLHDFHLELPLGAVSGSVTREGGSPVADLEVKLRAEQSSARGFVPVERSIWSDTVRTDVHGDYEIVVPERGFSFAISVSDGAVKQAQAGIHAGNEGIDFVLPEMGQLLFRAIRRGNGEGVDTYSLSWRPAGRGEFERVDPETQKGRRPYSSGPAEDADGFRRVRLPVGYVDLHLYAGQASFQSALRENVLVRGEDEPERLTFELERGIVLHLQLEPPGRLPPGAFVALPPAELWTELSCTRNERGNNRLSFGGRYPTSGLIVDFDSVGRSRVRGLAPGKYRLKVFHEPILLEPEVIEVGVSGQGSQKSPIVVRWTRQ